MKYRIIFIIWRVSMSIQRWAFRKLMGRFSKELTDIINKTYPKG